MGNKRQVPADRLALPVRIGRQEDGGGRLGRLLQRGGRHGRVVERRDLVAVDVKMGPGEDHFVLRMLQAWGVDGHNSHTNVCSASARLGYTLWMGADRPSPDYSETKFMLLLSA